MQMFLFFKHFSGTALCITHAPLAVSSLCLCRVSLRCCLVSPLQGSADRRVLTVCLFEVSAADSEAAGSFLWFKKPVKLLQHGLTVWLGDIVNLIFTYREHVFSLVLCCVNQETFYIQLIEQGLGAFAPWYVTPTCFWKVCMLSFPHVHLPIKSGCNAMLCNTVSSYKITFI